MKTIRKFRNLSAPAVNYRFFVSTSESDVNKQCLPKEIIKPDNIPLDYWKNVLWVASDVKETIRENKKKCLNLLDTNHVTLLFVKPHGKFQLAFTLGSDLLGARRTLYVDSNFENQPNAADSGKIFSRLTDMLITHGLHHDVLVKLVSKMTVPIFSASCNIHCLQKALSDFMTFQEKLKKLRGLTLAWIGPPNSLFNSYLVLASKFGIKIRYSCICSFGAGRMSPVHRFLNDELTKEGKYEAEEFYTIEKTVEGADIIATSMHPEKKQKITFQALKNAQPNWIFVHTLPRSTTEVCDEVFNHEKNLSWDTSENSLYIAMVGRDEMGAIGLPPSHLAIILTNLKNYQPKLKIPPFEGETNIS